MKTFCVVLVVVAAILFWLPYSEDPESASRNEADTKMSAAAQPEESVKYGPEVMVREVAVAAYERDFQVLNEYASEELKDHYGDPRALKHRVTKSLEDAPEVPDTGLRDVEVVGAAPENLFGEAVFYRVDVSDGNGARHVLYVVLREALNKGNAGPEKSADGAVYCYVFAEKEGTGESPEESQEAGSMRHLIGDSDTCVRENEKPPNSPPEDPPGGGPGELAGVPRDRGLEVVFVAQREGGYGG